LTRDFVFSARDGRIYLGSARPAVERVLRSTLVLIVGLGVSHDHCVTGMAYFFVLPDAAIRLLRNSLADFGGGDLDRRISRPATTNSAGVRGVQSDGRDVQLRTGRRDNLPRLGRLPDAARLSAMAIPYRTGRYDADGTVRGQAAEKDTTPMRAAAAERGYLSTFGRFCLSSSACARSVARFCGLDRWQGPYPKQ